MDVVSESYGVEVRNDRMGFYNDVIADKFHIISFPFTQLKTSAARNLAGAGEEKFETSA